MTRNSPNLAADPCRIGDDGVEIGVVGHAVEGAAERDEDVGLRRDLRVLGIGDDGGRVRDLAPDFQEGGEDDGGAFADGAAEQRALDIGRKVGPLVDDVGDLVPGPGTGEGLLPGCGIEVVEELRAAGDEEDDLGSDAGAGRPCAPVLVVGLELQVDEARGERRHHAVDDAAVVLAVAAGDEGGARRQLVFADAAIEDELVEGGLDHRDGGGQLLEIDEEAAGVVGRRQELGRGPARAVVLVAPGDAAQVDGIEEKGADVDILAAGGGRDGVGDVGLADSGLAPDHAGLAGIDQERERIGEFAGLQRVVGGDVDGFEH